MRLRLWTPKEQEVLRGGQAFSHILQKHCDGADSRFPCRIAGRTVPPPDAGEMSRTSKGLEGQSGGALVLVKDLGIEGRGEDVTVGDGVLVMLVFEIALQRDQVERLHGGARPALHLGQVLDDAAAQRLGEAARRLPQLSLQKLHHAAAQAQ